MMWFWAQNNSERFWKVSISAGYSAEADVQLSAAVCRGAGGDGGGPGHVWRRVHHGVQRGGVQAQSGEAKLQKVGDVDDNCDNGWGVEYNLGEAERPAGTGFGHGSVG